MALRLALIWHAVAAVAAGDDPREGCLSAEAMAAGEGLARWFIHEAERVYSAAGERGEDRAARTLTAWVRRRGGRVTARDLQRSNRSYSTAAAAETALDGLATVGLGRWEDAPTDGSGRPRGRVFVLSDHPADGRQMQTDHVAGLTPLNDTGADTPPEQIEQQPIFSGSPASLSDSVGCRPAGEDESTAPLPHPGGEEVLSAETDEAKGGTTDAGPRFRSDDRPHDWGGDQ